MSGQALIDALRFGGIAVMLIGMFAQVVSGGSIRPRPRLAAIGGILILTGFILPDHFDKSGWRLALPVVSAFIVVIWATRAIYRIMAAGRGTLLLDKSGWPPQ